MTICAQLTSGAGSSETDTRIVDEKVNAVLIFANLFGQPRDFRERREISRIKFSRCPQPLALVDNRCAAIGIAPMEQQCRTLGCELMRKYSTKPIRCACEQNDFVVQTDSFPRSTVFSCCMCRHRF